ncbi:MAG: helix-turn-helix transcriptional regulator [Vulcanimicrobiaceae bacterium]|jgi:DNA-binding CsgD family transcriptional regulator
MADFQGKNERRIADERVTIHDAVHVSPIERTILQALADGARSAEIAKLTRCARTTVETHVRTLFLKLDARSRSHLVAQAFRNGIISLEG